MQSIRGGSRRGGGRRGGSNARRKAAEGSADAKTSLVAEWRAHEEDCAARLLQHQLRAFLSRQRLTRLLASVYEKHYDPMRKQHYYVNTQTNASSWEKPRLLTRFLPADRDVARGRVEISPREAAQRIQRLVRAFLAWRTIRQLVRENYMKLFDEGSKTFFYLNTRTGERSEVKPPFFRRQDDPQTHTRRSSPTQTARDEDDLEIEPFHFRKAVCKISSSSNPHGSGVLGRFCGLLCVLSDGQTLLNEDTARAAQVICNLADGRVPFPVLLASDVFFAGIKLRPQSKQLQVQPSSPSKASRKLTSAFDFALCALNEEQFLLAAGTNVVPLRLELNDRKLGCGEAESLRLLDPLEVVGHPHGKRQVLHVRQLAKLEPNSINPQQLQYDRATETGAAGSAVFTRGGKLVGLQPFTPPKEPPPVCCWYIKPILDAALALVTPPEPVILTSNVSSTAIQVYWQLPREWQPLRGLPVEFELEVCYHATQNPQRHDDFGLVYLGPKRSHRIAELLCASMYSVRCRAVNRMKKGNWSGVVRFITLPQVSLSWRLRHCASVEEAVKRMQQQRNDLQVQFRSVQWIFAQLEKREEADKADQQAAIDDGHGSDNPIYSHQLRLEQELFACRGLELLFSSLTWFPNESATITLLLRLFLKLARFQKTTQRFLTDATRFEALCELLRAHTSVNEPSNQRDEQEEAGEVTKTSEGLQIPMLCLELLGAVLDENASAKLVCECCEGVPLVLNLLTHDPYRLQADVAAECCYILSIFSFNNAAGKWTVVEANGLALLQEVLQTHHDVSRVLYWALVTLGNVVYASEEATELPQLQVEISSLGLVDSVCACRVHFLSRLQELELELGAAEKELERLHAVHVGEETRNELDASENLVETLHGVITEWKRHDVAEAADYALRYLLTEEQRQVQAASQRFVRKFLQRTLSMAYEKWCEVTVFERHRAIFLMFVTTVRTRQLRPAFRRWELAMREMRKHKTILQTLGSGLAIDLAKKKKERYRMLVLQK